MRLGAWCGIGAFILACNTPPRPTSTPAASTLPAPPQRAHVVTELHVAIVDGAGSLSPCDGRLARRYEITLDGRSMGTVTVPCRVEIRAPPPRVHAEPFDVQPGPHRIGVRDLDDGRTDARTLQFPVLEPFEDGGGHLLADKLEIWADESTLDIGELRVVAMGL